MRTKKKIVINKSSNKYVQVYGKKKKKKKSKQ